MMKLCIFLLATWIPLVFLENAFAGEGHDAGRRWAESKGIDDPDDCRSSQPGRWRDDNINNSPSFTEGCLEHLRDEGITDDDDELIDEDDDDEDEEDDDEEEE